MNTASSFDWRAVAYSTLISRQIEALEATELAPRGLLYYQFSARGHDVAQVILARHLTHPRDVAGGYYRSRPFAIGLGLSAEEALASQLGRAGTFNEGRDTGFLISMSREGRATMLPTAGDVGAQYTPVVGWAQAMRYFRDTLELDGHRGCIAVAMGGDGSVASAGFWSGLNIATTLALPVILYIEDNGRGISVPSHLQTPGGNIADNLRSYGGLMVIDGDGSDPVEALDRISRAVTHTRAGRGPALLRLRVPRLAGHSSQDTQAYKSAAQRREDERRDPLPRLRRYMLAHHCDHEGWRDLERAAREEVRRALAAAMARPRPEPRQVRRHVYCERDTSGHALHASVGGVRGAVPVAAPSRLIPERAGPRVNMVDAIRMTLDAELERNPRVLVFGEDVGAKGGVHAATRGLQAKHGEARVFDTSLSEEGIIGRAMGMAISGLMPVPEIQFRKYADAAAEQISACGMLRWRTNNRFCSPMVVRMPVGFARVSDPFHGVCNEAQWCRSIGWRVGFPSNAEDAAGLLRSALRGHDPTMFLEHRSLLDGACARRPYPGDDFVVPFGRARRIRDGDALTIVTWGAMVARCADAVDRLGASVDLLDLRTLVPWDEQGVLDSVRKTGRCLIVHEDTRTAGFGAEISAVLADRAIYSIDAPIKRLAVLDVPNPYDRALLEAIVPAVSTIVDAAAQLLEGTSHLPP